MIIAEDFRLDYGEIIKALTGEHLAPTPEAHQPQPTGEAAKPRPGHKYVKRSWTGSGWQYEYPGEGTVQHHSQAHFGAHEQREHVLALPEKHAYGPGQEEQAYKETFTQAFKPGTVHNVPHPDPSKPGQALQVKAISGPYKFEVTDPEGKKQKFSSHAAYERWFRGIQLGAKKFSDPSGKPLFELVPNLGNPDESGFLKPSADPRNWLVKIADGADPELANAVLSEGGKKQKEAGKFAKLDRYNSKAAAIAALNNKARYLESTKNIKFNWQDEPGATVTPITPTTQVAPPPSEDQTLNTLRESKDPVMQSMGQYGWEEIPDPASRQMVRRLKSSPKDKEKLVQQVAMQYTPKIRNLVDHLSSSADVKRQQYWRERLFGDVPPGENVPFSPEPGTFIHREIERMVDNYKPEYGPFAAYANRALEANLTQHASRMRGEQSQVVSPEPGREITGAAATEEPLDVGTWRQMQESRLYQLARDKQLPEGFIQAAAQFVKQAKTDQDLDRFADIMSKYGHREYIMSKALMKAIKLLSTELSKAQSSVSPFITKDKSVDPSHQYDHREGDEDHPRYYFRDSSGNFIRYTNAPTGHSDASSRFGDAKLHPSEPTADKNSEFFDLKGRKLTRAPYTGAEVQWNPNYHPHDPNNLWAGRWVNPLTGEHEHTYVDADMRAIPKFQLHQAIILVDTRLPILRNYINTLSSSPHLKDKIVAVALALIDQGRFRAQELTMLTPAAVVDYGAVFMVGNRLIYADNKLRSMLSLMAKNRTPNEPLFAVPFVKKNGEVDETLIRRIGPHFLTCAFDQLGITIQGLQAYHASQTFSREVQRLLTENRIPWESALEYATVAVAQEMGHDLTQEPDMATALPLIRELLIDPIVIEVLQRNAVKFGLVEQAAITLPLPPPAIQYVSLDLMTRTADEEEFSKWVHSYGYHTHAEVQNFEEQRAPTAQPQEPNPPNEPSLSEAVV